MTPHPRSAPAAEARKQDQAHHKAVREFLHGKETNTARARRVRSPERAQEEAQVAANRELARKYRELAKQVESRGELVHEPRKEGYTPMVRRRVQPLRNPTDPTPAL
jgi:hypothetical protein